MLKFKRHYSSTALQIDVRHERVGQWLELGFPMELGLGRNFYELLKLVSWNPLDTEPQGDQFNWFPFHFSKVLLSQYEMSAICSSCIWGLVPRWCTIVGCGSIFKRQGIMRESEFLVVHLQSVCSVTLVPSYYFLLPDFYKVAAFSATCSHCPDVLPCLRSNARDVGNLRNLWSREPKLSSLLKLFA